MRISVTLLGLSPAQFTDVARACDRLGVDTLWLADHVVSPLEVRTAYPYSPSGKVAHAPQAELLDPLVLVPHLASVTTDLRFGTGVYVLPLRHPLESALAIRTVARLVGPRFVLGLGVGWMAEEHAVLERDFSTRGARLDEALDILHLAWTGEPFTYEGTHHQLPRVQQGGPPLIHLETVFGGTGRRALERAATRGQGWFGPSCELEESLEHRRRIDEARGRQGTADRPFRYYVRLKGEPSPGLVERYEDAGVEDMVVTLPRRTDYTIDLSEAQEFLASVTELVGR